MEVRTNGRKTRDVDERTLAYAGGSGDARGASIASSGVNEKPQIGRVQFDCGYLSPFFVTDPERMEVAFDNAFVLFQQGKITSKKDLFPLLDQIAKTGKPLLIIAEDVEGAALATHFELEKTPVTDSIWLPKHFAMKSQAKVLFLFSRKSQAEETYGGYHKSAPIKAVAP